MRIDKGVVELSAKFINLEICTNKYIKLSSYACA